jgi:hypothetical protein
MVDSTNTPWEWGWDAWLPRARKRENRWGALLATGPTRNLRLPPVQTFGARRSTKREALGNRGRARCSGLSRAAPQHMEPRQEAGRAAVELILRRRLAMNAGGTS